VDSTDDFDMELFLATRTVGDAAPGSARPVASSVADVLALRLDDVEADLGDLVQPRTR
jgi:hypothetical protein